MLYVFIIGISDDKHTFSEIGHRCLKIPIMPIIVRCNCKAAIMGCMEPLTAVSMGVLFLGERFGLGQILGVVIVLVAVFIVILSSHPGHFSMKRLIPAFIRIRK